MAFLHDDVLDDGLSQLDTEADKLHICSQIPTTYTEAITTYALGYKAAPTISAPADRTGGGRKVTVTAITDGTVDGTGTATHYALVDVSTTKLLAAGALNSSVAVTTGNVFSLTEFDIEIPDPA